MTSMSYIDVDENFRLIILCKHYASKGVLSVMLIAR